MRIFVQKLLERSVLIVMIAVICSLFASVAAFLWGAVKTATIVTHLATGFGKSTSTGIELIALMDTFLIATALLFFSLSMYELFIHEITLPAWLVVHNLHDLKAKLSSVIILVMAVTFLEHVVEWKDPLDTLYFSLAIAVVSAVLIAFSRFGEKD